MSEILIGTNPNKPQIVGSINFEATEAEKAKQLPTPAGYRILCAIPETEDTYESGIAKSDLTIKNDEVLMKILSAFQKSADAKDKSVEDGGLLSEKDIEQLMSEVTSIGNGAKQLPKA
jgi:hypothetical protein